MDAFQIYQYFTLATSINAIMMITERSIFFY